MKDEFDYTETDKNPYTKKTKKQIPVSIDEETFEYFRQLSDENGIPCPILINLFLRDCVKRQLKPEIVWKVKD